MEAHETRTIGAVARAAGVSVEALRYYEAEGLLTPARDASGRRRYSPTDEDALRVIMALRGAGFGIRDIDAVIGSKHDDDSPTQRVDAGLAVLAELSRQLDARQAALDEARALCTRWQRELRAAKKALAAGASPEDLLN